MKPRYVTWYELTREQREELEASQAKTHPSQRPDDPKAVIWYIDSRGRIASWSLSDGKEILRPE